MLICCSEVKRKPLVFLIKIIS